MVAGPPAPDRGRVTRPASGAPVAAKPRDDLLGTPAAGPAAVRGGTVRTAGYVAGVALSLVAVPFLVRHLGVDGFGRYQTVIAIATIAQGLTEFGVAIVALREWSVASGDERREAMRRLLGLRLAMTAAGVLGATAFAALAGYDEVLVAGALAASFGLGLAAIQTFLVTALVGDLRFGWATGLEFSKSALAVAGLLLLVLVGASLGPFFLVPIASAVPVLALTAWLVRGRMPLRPVWRAGTWWPLVRQTLPVAAASGVYVAYFRVAIIVMSLLASAEQTGYFATSYRVVEVLTALPVLALTAAFPVLSRAASEDVERLRYGVARVFEAALIGGVFLAVAVVLAAPLAIDVIAGPGFGPAVGVLQLQGLTLAASALASAMSFALLAQHLNRVVLIANLGALLLAVVLQVAVVPSYEAIGAAAATLAAEVVLALWSTGAVIRSGARLRPNPRIVGAALALGTLAAALALTPLPSIVSLALGTALYFGGLALAGLIPREALEAFTGWLGRPKPGSAG